MKQLKVSLNRPCFCNSRKPFKMCHGQGVSSDVLDTYQLHFILRDLYHKVLMFVKQNYDIDQFLKDFQIYNKIKDEVLKQQEMSFVFIDFLILRAKFKDSKKYLFEEIYSRAALTSQEKEFLKELKESSHFSIFKVLDVDKEKSLVTLEHLFDKQEAFFFDKHCADLVEKGGLLYGRQFNIFGRVGVLPTFNFRTQESLGIDNLDKITKSFEERLKNLQKEENPDLTFKDFINSIEHEIYGGDNPYEEFEMHDRMEQFLKDNPDKTEDDFFDLIEDELLDLK